jgi:hypothetical protein
VVELDDLGSSPESNNIAPIEEEDVEAAARYISAISAKGRMIRCIGAGLRLHPK